jgi:hypothetical protein
MEVIMTAKTKTEKTPTPDLDAMKRALAELEAIHGPNDGAVVELRAEIEKLEKHKK